MATAATTMNLRKESMFGGEVGAANMIGLQKKAEAEEDARMAAEKEEELSTKGPCARILHAILDALNSTGLQTCLYLVFVVIFQSLTMTLRVPEEFYLDKHVMDRIVENHFDSSHNTFETVRRIADIYEWGNNVLIPGLFADMGPCHGDVGLPNASLAKRYICNDDAWPDGEGSFHQQDATPYGLDELVKRMDQFDWTEGLYIRSNRQKPEDCKTTKQLGECYGELMPGEEGSTEDFGYNWTNPGMPPLHPYEHFTTQELGGNPAGIRSAAIPSMRTFDSGGFVAVAIPFFSDRYLTLEEGPPNNVTDYRDSYVTTSNGRTPRFYCVRVSTNGRHIKQLCDPGAHGNGSEPFTGAVRATVEEWFNDLKRGHFLDAQSRIASFTLQLKSNHVGIRYRITLLFELTSLGAIFPSYDVETRSLDQDNMDNMMFYATIALAMVIFFAMLELIEMAGSGGLGSYFSNMWNVMDWANYIIFFMVYAQLIKTKAAWESYDCSSYLCDQVGYFDDWDTMTAYRSSKLFLSLCVCIQLFKILKFAGQLVPKTELATKVLKRGAMDLLFFAITFIISMLAFSMMLYVQLGPVMEGYWDQIPAFISLFRALFGDFDIQEIMDNSSGYMNTLLFLGYLFVAIFIMLSMFLAILAEAQVAVREDEMAVERDFPDFKEYGCFETAGEYIEDYVSKPWRRFAYGDEAEEEREMEKEQEKKKREKEKKEKDEKEKVTNTTLLEAIMALKDDLAKSAEATEMLQQEVSELRAKQGLASASDPKRRLSAAGLPPAVLPAPDLTSPTQTSPAGGPLGLPWPKSTPESVPPPGQKRYVV